MEVRPNKKIDYGIKKYHKFWWESKKVEEKREQVWGYRFSKKSLKLENDKKLGKWRKAEEKRIKKAHKNGIHKQKTDNYKVIDNSR